MTGKGILSLPPPTRWHLLTMVKSNKKPDSKKPIGQEWKSASCIEQGRAERVPKRQHGRKEHHLWLKHSESEIFKHTHQETG